MIDRGKQNLLGIQINAVDYEAAVAAITQAAHAGNNLTVSALAVHGVMTGVLDPVHAYRLNQLDLVVPDGQPVRWALNLLHGTQLPDRVYGPTLTLKVCARAAEEQLSIYLYGSTQPVLDRLAANLRARFPNLTIAGVTPSYFRPVTADEKAQIVAQICASGAKIVFVGLGCPRQEVWVYEHREHLPMPLLAVGAAFDFHAGTLPQAPAKMQQWGLEWLYRLLREPKRLWQRYLFLNPYYVWLVALQYFGIRRYVQPTPLLPREEMRYG